MSSGLACLRSYQYSEYLLIVSGMLWTLLSSVKELYKHFLSIKIPVSKPFLAHLPLHEISVTQAKWNLMAGAMPHFTLTA